MTTQSTTLEFNAESLVDTLREPLLVLNADLRVKRANRSFFRTFHVSPEETVGQFIYDLGNQQWDIPALRKLLEEVLSESTAFDDFEVDHVFPAIGRKCMLLNARRLRSADESTESILLAIEDITARREADESRQAIENRYTTLVQNIRDHSIFMMDVAGRITTWNAEAERIIGYSESEILGRDFSVIFSEEDVRRGLPHRELRLALENGRAEDERRHVRKNGSRFWALGIVTPMFDASGAITGFSKILRDMTDRKLAEDGLRQSEQTQRFLLDSMPQKIFTARPNGEVDYFNPQWIEFCGLSFDQIKNWGWKQFIHHDDVDATVRLWQLSIDTGERFEFEHRCRRADGEYRWHVSRALPMRDEAGRVLMWIGSNTDVHDIKQTEAALQDSETRDRRLFETAKDGILILDAGTGRVIDANPFMSDLLGYSRTEFVGKELWEIGLFQDIEASHSAYRELKKSGYVRCEHLPLASREGHRVDVEFVSNVYPENERQVVQCNIRDITERCRLEQQTQVQAETLADLSRRKDEFLAMLSHELRDPLAPILSAVELLRLQPGGSPAQQKAQAIIERQVGQLTHLVDDLMEVSRVITGRIELRLEKIALCGIIERAVETTRPLIDQRRQELIVSMSEKMTWLNADAARLEQVVTNLLTNAAKYTPEGGRIWISAEREGGQAVLRVRDTGSGIAADFLPHVFDLFTQAERSSARSQGGLGIGLALAKRLVELHGGTIGASSTVGMGSEFVVKLHVQPSEEPSRDPPSAPTPPANQNASALRVLIVDDNEDAASALEMLVHESGHEVWVAHTGQEALTAARAYRPDVMLLDIGLPGLDGYEVAERIRRDHLQSDMVLVAMTGYGQESDRTRARAAGFDHHLTKPTDFSKVRRILTNVLQRAT